MPRLALEGVRVADFSWVISAPYGTRYLASMGAEVIRIGSQERSDAAGPGGASLGDLTYSKKSVTLNLRMAEGVALARQLIAISDVVMENYGTGVMERLGLGYEDLRKVKQDIIMCSVSGLGRTGPEREAVSYASIVTAYAGMTSFTGYVEGVPKNPGASYADPVAGTTAVLGILAALEKRRRTGEGSYVDVSMVEAVLPQMPEPVLDYLSNGRVWDCIGNQDDVKAPHGVYRCRGENAWIAIAVGCREEWQGLCRAVGRDDWAKDPRFDEDGSRWEYRAEFEGYLAEWARAQDRWEAVERLQREGVPAGSVYDARDIIEDPHLRERGFLVQLDSSGGRLFMGHPWALTPDGEARYEPGSTLGQDNEYVFRGLLGLSETDFINLVDLKVIH